MFSSRPFVTLWIALAFTAAAAASAAAGEKAGVQMPDQVKIGEKELVLNGMGVREATVLNVDVYVAGLYVEKKSSDPKAILGEDQARMIHMHFVRDVDRSDIVEAWKTGFANNARDQIPALEDRIERMNSWMTSFNSGQTLTLAYVPGRGTTVAIDGKNKGTIQGADFAQALFAIWLGPKPPNQGLKQGLLGR